MNISRVIVYRAALIALCICVAFDWLTARTTRVFVDELHPAPANCEQQFNVRGRTVKPEIVTRGAATITVPIDSRLPHVLVFSGLAVQPCSIQISIESDSGRKVLLADTLTHSTTRSVRIEGAARELILAASGSMIWRDVRLVRPVFLWPAYVGFGAALLWLCLRIRVGRTRTAEWLTLVATIAFCLLGVEMTLRHLGRRLPAGIRAVRTELGAVPDDTRLFDRERYRLRLRPNLRTTFEWRYGDIARLGFVAQDVCPGELHRYSIRTDSEGFRNDSVRPNFDIAALGDSFTDGATGPAAEAWPAVLERLTGKRVQNYGTSGFGPQQEACALDDFVVQKHPRTVVLAFCAGNDLHDAEAFDEWERAGAARPREEREGSRIAQTFRRYETLYLWSALRAAKSAIAGLTKRETPHDAPSLPAGVAAQFDRGMFSVRSGAGVVRGALLPPYLERAADSRAELQATHGWQLTAATLHKMKTECADAGIEFRLMFIPEKTQVQWPLIARSLPDSELERALQFYRIAPETTRALINGINRNRVAQNELLRDFCAQEGIPMLDLTNALEHEVASGREVYLPDDTHWNAAGHEVAARELAAFLAAHP